MSRSRPNNNGPADSSPEAGGTHPPGESPPVRCLEPIWDTSLVYRLDEFRDALPTLESTVGAEHLASVRHLSDLSRGILFRILPGELEPEHLREVADLFQSAANRIKVDPGEPALARLRSNILERKRHLLSELK